MSWCVSNVFLLHPKLDESDREGRRAFKGRKDIKHKGDSWRLFGGIFCSDGATIMEAHRIVVEAMNARRILIVMEGITSECFTRE
ncbi:7895_t:CDS:2 [Acaulospora morrowiae]|uniref:7895_t:CDS:1 n=1 Tax=Acaulospora morrowiae TaxID=94023 RepID=A0A9N8W6K0_9GLOM|nr:7895_t:CDS:2 [Acaulospora morrowiae]